MGITDNLYPDRLNIINQKVTINHHPFKGPKLHLYKKGASRRIKTSSATRNLKPIYYGEGLKNLNNLASL